MQGTQESKQTSKDLASLKKNKRQIKFTGIIDTLRCLKR